MEQNIYNNLLNEMNNNLRIFSKNESNDEYNVFDALEIESKEVLTCRFICSLLYKDKQLLHNFFEMVLKEKQISENPTIVLEHTIKDNRRVDIVIYDGNKIYPIEVKIWADDQDKQLYDYYHYFFKEEKNEHNKIYYLTPLGKDPSAESKAELEDDRIQTLSFKEHICEWIKESKNECENERIRNILDQYLEVINKMCEEDKKINALKESIGLSEGFKYSNNLVALIEILFLNKNKNSEIQRLIQKEYLKKFLEYNHNTYYLDDDVKDCGDKNAVLKLIEAETGRLIALICIDTNLYIRCESLREKKQRQETWYDNCWAYLKPYGYSSTKAYCLNDCENIIDYGKDERYKIDITSYLNDIAID